MLKAVLKVNGLYYAGESDETYKSGFSGVGWHDYKNSQLTMLKFVENQDDASLIEGNINLKSCLDKVLQRIRDKAIDFESIEIVATKEKTKCGR